MQILKEQLLMHWLYILIFVTLCLRSCTEFALLMNNKNPDLRTDGFYFLRKMKTQTLHISNDGEMWMQSTNICLELQNHTKKINKAVISDSSVSTIALKYMHFTS